jgi:hypothetical protein
MTWMQRLNLDLWLGGQPAGKWNEGGEQIYDARKVIFPKSARERFTEDMPDGRQVFDIPAIKAAQDEPFDLEKAELKKIKEVFGAWAPEQSAAYDTIRPIMEILEAPAA